MEVTKIEPGLWRWTAPHPLWRPDRKWPRDVGSVFAEVRGAIVLIDPLLPSNEADRFWDALDRDRQRLGNPPVHVLLTCTWHRRSSEDIADRYDSRILDGGDEMPDGVDALVFDDGGWREVVFLLCDYAAVVFGDVIEGDGHGGLQMPPEWWPKEEQRTVRIRRELRQVLNWSFERVLVSHGEPVLWDGRSQLSAVLAD